jgi:hypothetical protein
VYSEPYAAGKGEVPFVGTQLQIGCLADGDFVELEVEGEEIAIEIILAKKSVRPSAMR